MASEVSEILSEYSEMNPVELITYLTFQNGPRVFLLKWNENFAALSLREEGKSFWF